MKRPVIALSIVLLASVAACASGPPSTTPARAPRPTSPAVPRRSGGCDRAPVAPGTHQGTMISRGVERRYEVTLPPRYTGRTPLPVVFGLHALTVSYLTVPAMYGLADMTEKFDFIAVAPSGRLDGTTPFWLAAPVAGNYDVAFIAQLLDRIENSLCVDPARVFATGMSNGAQMSSLLACRLADRITAVAPDAGVEFYDTCRGRPVPVIAFHGRLDPIVRYDGGGLNARTIANQEFWKGAIPAGVPVNHGVDAAMRAWAAHNDCDPYPVDARITAHVVRRTWQHCRAATVLYIVENGGHAWPGRPVPAFEAQFGFGTKEIDATSLMFAFFFAQPPISAPAVPPAAG